MIHSFRGMHGNGIPMDQLLHSRHGIPFVSSLQVRTQVIVSAWPRLDHSPVFHDVDQVSEDVAWFSALHDVTSSTMDPL